MYYLYILYSPSSDRYYVGSTQNYRTRLHQHNYTSEDSYTSKHRPWILKAVFEAGSKRGDAEKVERFVKQQKNRELIEKLVNPDFQPMGKLAQLVRVPHVRD